MGGSVTQFDDEFFIDAPHTYKSDLILRVTVHYSLQLVDPIALNAYKAFSRKEKISSQNPKLFESCQTCHSKIPSKLMFLTLSRKTLSGQAKRIIMHCNLCN